MLDVRSCENCAFYAVWGGYLGNNRICTCLKSDMFMSETRSDQICGEHIMVSCPVKCGTCKFYKEGICLNKESVNFDSFTYTESVCSGWCEK